MFDLAKWKRHARKQQQSQKYVLKNIRRAQTQILAHRGVYKPVLIARKVRGWKWFFKAWYNTAVFIMVRIPCWLGFHIRSKEQLSKYGIRPWKSRKKYYARCILCGKEHK